MHNKDENNLEKISSRISAGIASEADKARYAKWLAQLDLEAKEPSYQQVEQMRLEFQRHFDQNQRFPNQKRRRSAVWFPAAAAAILILLISIWLLIPHTKTKREPLYSVTTTKAGERKIITLSDGSKVTLNNLSHLKFPEVFSDSLREVVLDGEAFFDIAHQKNKPFIVRTGKLDIQVLGTSFDVKSYRNDHQFQITVATGKVGVLAQNKKKSWMLTPGQQLSYNQKTGLVSKSIVAAADYINWQQGELIFKNEPLESICKRLERWYDVSITIQGTVLKNKRINLEQKNESLQNVLRMLAIVGEFHYELKGKNVQIW